MVDKTDFKQKLNSMSACLKLVCRKLRYFRNWLTGSLKACVAEQDRNQWPCRLLSVKLSQYDWSAWIVFVSRRGFSKTCKVRVVSTPIYLPPFFSFCIQPTAWWPRFHLIEAPFLLTHMSLGSFEELLVLISFFSSSSVVVLLHPPRKRYSKDTL